MSLQYDITQAALGARQYTNDTAKAIKTGCKNFASYCKSEGLNKMTKIQDAGATDVIQSYTDHLVSKEYSPSTIHTYVYGACKAFDIRMSEIKKPKRLSSAIKRSRDEHANPLGKAEAGKPEYARLVGLQERVGIRRSELARLTGASLTIDESNHLAIALIGKGGKPQKQRILPKDEQYVKDFFEGLDPDKYVFTSTELRNHIDLHGMRAAHAREAYSYYAGLSGDERKALLHELCQRWLVCHPDKNTSSPEFRRWYEQMTKGGGAYRLRGDNYDRAVRAGRPTSYDRTALMAVSVFHLSHWRLSVTVTNYLI